MRRWQKVAISLGVLAGAGAAFSYCHLPTSRVKISSELIMLGDLDGDREWGAGDLSAMERCLASPFASETRLLVLLDLNRDGLVEPEDLSLLRRLCEFGDPYRAEAEAREQGQPFPRPRELFRYFPTSEYLQRPLFTLEHASRGVSPFAFLRDFEVPAAAGPYERQLLREIYDEALRFSCAWELRRAGLSEVEAAYAEEKIRAADELYQRGARFELLLHLIGLVEDAETLTTRGQSEFVRQLLPFRDSLRELLLSEDFAAFSRGEIGHQVILARVEERLKEQLQIELDVAGLEAPRDLLVAENYLDRAEWQAYKTSTKNQDFRDLVLYAQYDRRYLRAVSRTSPRHQDLALHNHNLPMELLFREALRIEGGDKKAAVGLLDEAIRIPMSWVKSIPPELLPSSLALENFLLPGNMEDGSDKSRHWNVFGGVALYKSPEESLLLSFRREADDLRAAGYAPEAMREFVRDTIANIHGIYAVVSIQPRLLEAPSQD
ncbi:MAG: hypothetical protein H8E31_08035 [Planctomycetes bacterium]|nr:hypothetical protein [Planctomycetota bacterium]